MLLGSGTCPTPSAPLCFVSSSKLRKYMKHFLFAVALLTLSGCFALLAGGAAGAGAVYYLRGELHNT